MWFPSTTEIRFSICWSCIRQYLRTAESYACIFVCYPFTSQLVTASYSSTVWATCISYHLDCCQICCSNHKPTIIDWLCNPRTALFLQYWFRLLTVLFFSAEVLQETFFLSSWELFWSTRVDLFTSQTKSPTQLAILWVEGKSRNLLTSQFTTWRWQSDDHQFAVANANLASEISHLQAEISQLQLKATPTLEEQRAMLVYSAAVQSFRQNSAYNYLHMQSSLLPDNIWLVHYPGRVSPPARTSDYCW